MSVVSLWPSTKTAIGTLNVNGWLRRPRESRRAKLRRVSVMRIIKKHQLDVLGLQETHLQDQDVCSLQS